MRRVVARAWGFLLRGLAEAEGRKDIPILYQKEIIESMFIMHRAVSE